MCEPWTRAVFCGQCAPVFGSLQIAEQWGHWASLLKYKLCILYIVKLKGIRLPFIGIAVMQANQSSFYWREQDLMHFEHSPSWGPALFFFFSLYCFISLLVQNLPDLHSLKAGESQDRTTNWMDWGSKLGWFVHVLKRSVRFWKMLSTAMFNLNKPKLFPALS